MVAAHQGPRPNAHTARGTERCTRGARGAGVITSYALCCVQVYSTVNELREQRSEELEEAEGAGEEEEAAGQVRRRPAL